MKNLWRLAQSLGFLCVIGSAGLFVLNVLMVIAALFGVRRPFRHFQYLGAPFWSVALPALGIFLLLPLALREAFTHRIAPEEKRQVKPADWLRTIDKWRGGLRFGRG
ncbi:MAG TPA: hypothetical protein VIM99_10615 [Blastocatellia bacterium]